MKRRSAIVAASFVVVVAGDGCKKKNVTDVAEYVAVRDGRCLRTWECRIIQKWNDDPCDQAVPAPQPIDCPLTATVRKKDGLCYFPHELKGPDAFELPPMGNPPPPPPPQVVVCPAGVKDYVPGKSMADIAASAKAAASASASSSPSASASK